MAEASLEISLGVQKPFMIGNLDICKKAIDDAFKNEVIATLTAQNKSDSNSFYVNETIVKIKNSSIGYLRSIETPSSPNPIICYGLASERWGLDFRFIIESCFCCW